MTVIKDDHRLYALLFVGWDSANWLVQVVEESGRVKIVWRMRYHDPILSNDVWGGLDEKNWYESTAPGLTSEDAINAALAMQDAVSKAPTPPGFGALSLVDGVVEPAGDQRRIMSLLKEKPWVHMKTFDSKEAAEKFWKGKQPS
jgi:hypothetical protein